MIESETVQNLQQAPTGELQHRPLTFWTKAMPCAAENSLLLEKAAPSMLLGSGRD